MARYIIRRFVFSVVALWIIASLTFILMKAIPGDPFQNPHIPDQIHAILMHDYGLDKPLGEQYVLYLKQLAHGNLGISLRFRGRSVNQLIAEGFPVSALLGAESLAWGISLAILLGLIAALNRNRSLDMVTMAVAIISISVPNFVLGGMLQWILGVKLGWLPIARWPGDFIHTVMPALALGAGTLGGAARLMRTSVLEIITSDYVRTAKAKGLGAVKVIWSHVIRNSLLPIVTILGPLIAAIMTGSFVIEQMFGIPGLGKYFVNSITDRDYPLIMGVTLFYAAFLILMNFLVDVAYGFVDPRIRLTGRREM